MLEVWSFSSMETTVDSTGFCVCVGFIWISGDSLFDIQEKQLHEDLKNCSRVSFFFQLHYKSCLQMIRLFLNEVMWKNHLEHKNIICDWIELDSISLVDVLTSFSSSDCGSNRSAGRLMFYIITSSVLPADSESASGPQSVFWCDQFHILKQTSFRQSLMRLRGSSDEEVTLHPNIRWSRRRVKNVQQVSSLKTKPNPGKTGGETRRKFRQRLKRKGSWEVSEHKTSSSLWK